MLGSLCVSVANIQLSRRDLDMKLTYATMIRSASTGRRGRGSREAEDIHGSWPLGAFYTTQPLHGTLLNSFIENLFGTRLGCSMRSSVHSVYLQP